MKKIISIITLVVLINACVSEERFERMNISPTALTDEMIALDYNFGTRFNSIFTNLTAGQSGEEHNSDTYCRHFATPSIFANNINGATYNFREGWNSALWNQHYNNVMAPCLVIKDLALNSGLELFAAWAELLQVTALSRLTTYHGPLIYSQYGEGHLFYVYDSEEYLYQQFFDKLDEIQTVFKANLPTGNAATDANLQIIQAKFDPSYGGNLAQWLKYINSLRLRLAMRLVKANPEWAERMWKQAVNDQVGLILTNADNFNISLYGGVFPHWQVSDEWTDTRMGSGHEEVLLGYKDPRLYVWWQPVRPPAGTTMPEEQLKALYADHPDVPYKGIAGGAYLEAKADRTPFSALGTYFNNSANKLRNFRRFMTAEEVHFACAEAALRGWPTPGSKSVQQWYEDGVKLSWEEWGIDINNAERPLSEYLDDDTSQPLEKYVDPIDLRNNYDSRMKDISIKWDESADPEKKLERIMMQKWIGAFVNSNEMWADHRRTGYPKVPLAIQNNSGEQWGIISNDEPYPFPKRFPFYSTGSRSEVLNNPDGVKDAIVKLGGPDKISTSLWIHPDPGGPNF